jgi:hypothetical protein
MTITWLLATAMANKKNKDEKTYSSNAGHFDCPDIALVQSGMNRPMEVVQGLIRSLSMLPLGNYLYPICENV